MSIKPKILMFGPVPPPYGGMSVYIKNIIESELINKVDLKILNTKVPNFFFKYRIFRIFLSLKFLLVYIMFLLTFPFQIVHIHTSANIGFWEKGFFALLSKALHKKVIIHIHGSEFKEFCENSKYKKIIALILNQCDTVIVLSEIWARFIKAFSSQNNVKIVENGIDLRPFYKGKIIENSKYILFVGTLGKRKGLYTILESIKSYPELQSTDVKFYFVGKGLNEKDHIDVLNKYRDENIGNAIFLGELIGEEKYSYYRNSHIFILPSFAEGFPIAILEAMASYLPIISTTVGGIPDMIDKENGILISPGESDELGKALIKLINSPDLCEKMGHNNRRKIKKYYNLDQMLKKIYNLYLSILKF